MNNSSYHSTFTPSQSDQETLESLFVVREELAKRILTSITESAKSGDKHQILLVGPRGIGKTHLISLLYYRVNQDDSLSDLLRIAWLPEDPYIAGYQDLLMLILKQLQQEYDLVELEQHLEGILDLNDVNQAELALEQLLLNYLNGKTLLLIAENFDDLLSDLNESGQRKLRAFIQNHPIVTILATATSLIDDIAERKKTFFGFFKVHTLDQFNPDQAVRLLTQLAKRADKPDLVEAINSPMGKARIRAIHYLAGGNPRIYAILFDFLTRDSLDDLVRPLMKLINDLTPYYQGRMDRLSPLQRKIIDILRRLKGAATVKDIARQAMNTSQTVSSQLGKLVDLGYVIQADSVGRSNYYEMREPLMRLCLEVKEQRGENVALFIQFLRVWYSQWEFQAMLAQGCDGADAKYIQEAAQLSRIEPDPLKQSLESEFFRHQHANDYQAALQATEIAIQRNPEDRDYWLHKAECIEKLTYPLEEQLACWQKISNIDPEYMYAWNQLGLLLGQLGRHEEALNATDKAIALKPNDPILQRNYGLHLQLLGRNGESQEYFKKAIELEGEPTTTEQWRNRGNNLHQMGRQDGVLNAFSQAVKLDPRHIGVWNNLLGFFQEQGRSELNKSISERLVKLIPDNAMLQFHLGVSCNDLGLHEQALLAYERALELDPELNVNTKGDLTTLYRSITLSLLGRHTESLENLEHYSVGTSKNTAFRSALIKTHILMSLDRWEEGKKKMDVCLGEFDSSVWSGQDLAFIMKLIEQSQNPDVWRRFISVWLELFAKHGLLSKLGEGLVRRIRTLAISFISIETAHNWLGTWQDLAGKYEEMTIPLRLLKAGVAYKETRDTRVLLELAREERQLLEPWLINLFKEEPDEIDREMENLLVIVEQRLAEQAEQKRIEAFWQAPPPDPAQIDFKALLTSYKKDTDSKVLHLLPGKWQDLSLPQAEKLLKLVTTCEENGARSLSRKGLQVVKVEKCPLQISDWWLYQVHIVENHILGALDVIGTKDDVKILDGSSPTIYNLLEKKVLKIKNSNQKIQYVRFFNSTVRGKDGRFHVFDELEDLDIPLANVTQDKPVVQPWIYEQDDEDKQPMYKGTILYSGTIFQAEVKLINSPTGMVEMIDDEPIDCNISLPREYFDGPFRFKR